MMMNHKAYAEQLDDPSLDSNVKAHIVRSIKSELCSTCLTTSMIQADIPRKLISLAKNTKTDMQTINDILHCFCNLSVCDTSDYYRLIKSGVQETTLGFLNMELPDVTCELVIKSTLSFIMRYSRLFGPSRTWLLNQPKLQNLSSKRTH